MTAGQPDPDLLSAFVPEFRQGALSLAEATQARVAERRIANLRAMAEAIGIAALLPPLDEALAAIEPFDPAALREASRAMLAALDGAVAPQGDARSRVRAMVVDDSAMMRRLLRECLAADDDFEVVAEAGDGAAALALAAEHAPALILLDIEMPGMDGLTMLRHWAIGGTGAVVVVSSVAAPGSAVARDARRLGASAVVAKPSGALSGDFEGRRGAALRAAARRAAGLPPAPGAAP